MKKILAVILMVSAMAFAGSAAESKSMGIGGWLQAGNPGEHAGLDLQMRQAPNITLDIYLHFYFSNGDNSLGGYFGYYWNYILTGVPGDVGRMGFYVGPVGGLGWWDEDIGGGCDESGISIRVGVVGGYQWEFPVIPLQLYLELNPVGEFHYFWWEDDHNHDDSDTDWELPDFYFRIGLRFWF